MPWFRQPHRLLCIRTALGGTNGAKTAGAVVAVILLSFAANCVTTRRATGGARSCVGGLLEIEDAKGKAAFEHGWSNGTPCDAGGNLVRVNKWTRGNVAPICPQGGRYTYNPIGQDPVCSLGTGDDSDRARTHGGWSSGQYAKPSTDTNAITWNPHNIPRELGPEIQRAYVVSANNSNTLFCVTMFAPWDGWRASPVITVGPRTYDHWGTGRNMFQLDGVPRGDAEVMAGLLGTRCQMRRHPGHELTGTFVPKQEAYAIGSHVLIKFSLKNVGRVPVVFAKGGDYRATGRHERFTFMITRDGEEQEDVAVRSLVVGDPISHVVFGGGHITIVLLKPGEADDQEVDLSKWCAFDKAGEYVVRGSFRLDLSTREHRDRPPWPDSLKWAHEHWDDSVSATFRVRVRE